MLSYFHVNTGEGEIVSDEQWVEPSSVDVYRAAPPASRDPDDDQPCCSQSDAQQSSAADARAVQCFPSNTIKPADDGIHSATLYTETRF